MIKKGSGGKVIMDFSDTRRWLLRLMACFPTIWCNTSGKRGRRRQRLSQSFPVLLSSKENRSNTQDALWSVNIICSAVYWYLRLQDKGLLGSSSTNREIPPVHEIHYRQALSTKTEYITTSTKRPGQLDAHPKRYLQRDHTELPTIPTVAVPDVLWPTDIP